MDKPTTLLMLNIREQSERVHPSNLIFVLPILARPEQLQVYDNKGQVFICARDYFEKEIRKHHSHGLESFENIWVDRSFWNEKVLESDILRSLNAFGGISDIPMADLLMIVKKGGVYTLFTDQGLFFMPVISPIKTLCPSHEFNYNDMAAWRKGKTPNDIQDYVFGKGIEWKRN